MIGCLVGPILVVPEDLLRSVTSGLIHSVYRGVYSVSGAATLLRKGAHFLGVQPVIFEYNTSGVGVKSGIFTGGAWPMLGLLLAASYVLQYTVFFMSMHRLGFLEGTWHGWCLQSYTQRHRPRGTLIFGFLLFLYLLYRVFSPRLVNLGQADNIFGALVTRTRILLQV